jgi:hypothetical protein
VILGNDANPATAAVHNGVMWVGTQTFQGLKTLSGSGAAAAAVVGDGTAPTSLNILANGAGVAAVNFILNGAATGYAATTPDALYLGNYNDYAPTNGAAAEPSHCRSPASTTRSWRRRPPTRRS